MQEGRLISFPLSRAGGVEHPGLTTANHVELLDRHAIRKIMDELEIVQLAH